MERRDCFAIVSAGDLFPEDFERIRQETFIAAADAGYAYLEQQGVRPDLIIGDFDSSEMPGTEIELIRLPVVKDDTDTVYCVKEGLKRGYTEFRLYGALGGKRLSHTVANLQLLQMIRDRGARAEIISGPIRVFMMGAGEKREFPGTMAGSVSFFAVSEEVCLTLKGVEYELEHGKLDRHFPLGVSNHFTGREAFAAVHEGDVLVIIEEGLG